jgi:Acyl-coenzyme A:6-aminopenicillanic acid acyl-transferase
VSFLTPRLFLAALLAAALAPAQADSRPAPKGTLSVEKGVRVMRLRGTPAEIGYAHGFLLAAEIVEGFETYVVFSPVVGGPKNYEGRIVPKVRKQMTFLPEHEAELAGLLEGIRARLGEAARVPALDRPLELIDLKVLNTYGDWYQFACSSFSAWGKMTPDGETITARNFDFYPSPVLEKGQLLIAYAPADPARKRWVNVGFPGVLGVISGMNEDGVGLFVHDVRRRPGSEHETGVNPRLLVLRAALETTGPEGAPETVWKKLQARTTSMGNNVHVTSPYDRKHAPAGVIEYDGVETEDDGADLRAPAEGSSTVCCTNHYRLRSPPSACRRYAKMDELLAEAQAKGTKVDAAQARSIMGSIVQKSLVSRTIHTVVFFPAARRFEVMMGKDGQVATAFDPVGFTLAELFPPRN